MRHSYGSPLRRKMRAKNDAEAVRLLRKVCMSIIVIRLSESNNISQVRMWSNFTLFEGRRDCSMCNKCVGNRQLVGVI